jgi:hypothetical protein
MTTKRWWKALALAGAFALAATLIASPSPAHAQQFEGGGCDDEGASEDDAGAFRKVIRDGEVVYEFTGTVRVCGKVPKPNVVVILLEKTVGYEWDKLKQDFLPKIHNSLKGAPF